MSRYAKPEKNRKLVMDALVMVLQFGINMLVPIFMCTFAGVWLGNRFGISWLALPFFFIGAAAGANNIYRMAKKMINTINKQDR